MGDTKERTLTESRHSKSHQLDELSTMEIIRLMNEEDHTVPAAIEKSLPQIERAIDTIVAALNKGGRLIYIGAGTSGRLGVLDASECPPTFGVPETLVQGIIAGDDHALRHAIENAEDDWEEGEKAIKEAANAKDVVVGIASSGRTPYVLGAVEAAKQLGAKTVGLTCNGQTPLAKAADFPIEVLVGPEILTGSTRLKAGSAQKMVLNMISTASMVKTGKVYRNLMVNVQATNEKLKQRSVSIIQELTGATEEEAQKASIQAKGDARIAILMLMFQIDAEKARDVLKQENEHFSAAVKRLQDN
ncbi:N-acetylmuramic acid 6-phosphate etherase [Thalassobacillus devorans]|uniref:N-acetylmuramic acid 6-phosphate etherase n=1 Tax=Thalassobacillus devorans TaxID=279813 RepID=A0ABQ1NVN8_9BACI|nr:N-acetylmuramic acid 6-phosphate etherase [Thalassobacillus devorans]NIK28512.1 N-acetylmuramic acid 6-phosphate etherase [Thalassobacillus devorans]GGC85655.1 N-acetylmuramic acid 6-phosphate etherase [Thalassobacillus devorans]